jgi:hypothetical protein
VSAKPPGRMQIPGGVAGGRWPARQVGPAAGTGNEHPHPEGGVSSASTASSAAKASCIPLRV